MLKRIFVGLLIGLVVGGGVAALLTQGLGISFEGNAGALFAYLFAAAVGVLTGLLAGKPIWSQTGKIEAGLKAFFGALLSVGAMFAIRQWAQASFDLSAWNAGSGVMGDLPVTTLPLIGAVLGGLFEADNTPESDDEKAKTGSKVRVGAKASATTETAGLEDDEQAAAKKQKR
jgi:hypothetical protein